MNEFGFVEDTVEDDFGFVAEEDLGFVEDTSSTPEPEKEFSVMDDIVDPAMAGVAGFADTVTMGLGDETAAGMAAAGDWAADKVGYHDMGDQSFTDMYQQRLAQGQEAQAQLQERNPNAFLAGERTGFGTQLMAPGGAVTKGVAGPTKEAASAALTNIGKIPGVQQAKQGVGAVVDAVKSVTVNPVKKISDKVVAKGSQWVEEGVAASPVGKYEKTKQAAHDALSKGRDRIMDAGGKPSTVSDVQMAQSITDMTRLGTAKSALKGALPRTAGEATAQAVGHSFVPGGGFVLQHMVRHGTLGKMTSAAGKKLNAKYGQWLTDQAARGSDAITANVFIKQQNDPEFRTMMKQANEEEANQSQEQ
ncbi:hypothetical protein OAG36_01175 [bacterium]|nr:hypothetical protein [bacterium]